MEIVVHNLNHSLMIIVFVFVMMMFVDYIEVLTQGKMSKIIKGGYWRQYIMASALALTPGCLGAFMNVSFYVHGLLTFGAITGSMIAIAGEGLFIMLTIMPQKAIFLFGILFVLGILSGWVIDKVSPILGIRHSNVCPLSELHIGKECYLLNLKGMVEHFKRISLARFLLLTIFSLFIYLTFWGMLEIEENWLQITFLAILSLAIFIVITVPEHYLEEHIWQHIAKKHIWRVFLWTFFTLLLMDIGLEDERLKVFIENHMLWVLLIVALVSIIPEPGVLIVFVMMFCEGIIPFSILLTSCIIQDGHGMLPLLSYSIKDAILIKVIKLLIGLMCGIILYMIGF